MKGASLILAATTIVAIGIIIGSLYGWKRYKIKGSFWILTGGSIALLFCVFSYLGKLPVIYTLATTFLVIPAWCWSIWTTFKDKKFFWYTILFSLLGLTSLYGFIFAKIDFSLPFSQWPLFYYSLILSFITTAAGLILI